MKLLPKTKIASLKSDSRKLDIDEGVKLAKTVDALRQAKATEEANLAKFRDASLKEVQSQINEKVKELDKLKTEIIGKREERMALEAPIDLTNEWKEVNALKVDLQSRETDIISKEILLHEVKTLEKSVKEKEQKAILLFEEASKSYTKADDLRSNMESKEKESIALFTERSKKISEQEKDLIDREFVVKQQLDNLEKEKKELLDAQMKLIERESSIESNTKALNEREYNIKEMEALTKRFNEQAVINHDTSEKLKNSTESFRKQSEEEIKNRYEELQTREQEIGYKERDLILERDSLESQKREMDKEKVHIASQQATLRTAWQNIKNLQK